MTLDPNDPKLTAYALGELDAAERAAVEKALEDSPKLREAVEEIRRTGDLLTEHLQSEPAPTLTPEQRQAVLHEPDQALVSSFSKPRRRRLWLSLAAAACVLLAVGTVLWSLSIDWGARPAEDRVAMLADKSVSMDSAEGESGRPWYMDDDVDYENRLIGPIFDPGDPLQTTNGKSNTMAGASSDDLEPARVRISLEGSESMSESPAFAPDSAPVPAQPQTVRNAGPGSLAEGYMEYVEGPVPLVRDGDSITSSPGDPIEISAEEISARDGSSHTIILSEDFSRNVRAHTWDDTRQGGRPGQTGELGGEIEGLEQSRAPLVAQQRQRADDAEARLAHERERYNEPRFRLEAQHRQQLSEFAGSGAQPGDRGEKADSGETQAGVDRLLGGTGLPQDTGNLMVVDGKVGAKAEPGPLDSDKQHKELAGVSTWRRAKATPNASRLMVGDKQDLPLEGMQANVTIDGFRARVLLDYYFYNDGDQQYEGTFKLRLPSDASLYFFAFGESVYRYRPQEKKNVRGAFLTVSYSKPADGLPDEILKLRADSWNTPKVAGVVPREKAAFAYRQTVRRRVDPALVEWSGAGVFSARVFPLAPHKLYRIVVGYDVDLVRVEGDLEYRLDLPEVAECTVDLNLSAWAGGSARITPDERPFMSNNRACYHFADLPGRELRVRLEDPGTVLLSGADEKTGDYFATRFRPELPEDAKGTCASTAVFLVDTSLSSNPDKFNVWLKLLRAVLDKNRDAIDQFAVLLFNVEAHWWQEKFVKNTPENVQKLLDYAHTLALEGATDLEQAFREAASPSWLDASEEIAPWDVFLLSDGALNWGETNVHVLADSLTGNASLAGALFAYETGMAGTESRVLDHLARETGGAVFAVVAEAQVDEVARAHRQRPWQLLDVQLEGGSDLLVAGRPKTIFPGSSYCWSAGASRSTTRRSCSSSAAARRTRRCA